MIGLRKRTPIRSPQKLSDAAKVRRVFDQNFSVYGVRKVWRLLRREGFGVARCTVSRLMRNMGLQGAIRGKTVKTTISDKAARRPPNLRNRIRKTLSFSRIADGPSENTPRKARLCHNVVFLSRGK
jgi:transposase InsO family protein